MLSDMALHLEQHRAALALLLALALVRGVIYAAVIPPWQAPDEFRHFEYIKLLHQERRLLTTQDTSLSLQREIIASMIKHEYWRFGRVTFPFDPDNPPQSFEEIIWPVDPYWLFQPPLYYLMAASLLVVVDQSDIDLQLYVLRFLSVIFGAVVVFIAFLTATELFPDDNLLIVGIPAFITFLPMHTFVTSAINNDNLAELLVSVILLILVKGYKEGFSPLKIGSISLLVALGLLTKRTTVMTLPILAVAIPIYLWRGGPRGLQFNRAGVTLIIGVIIVGVISGVAFRNEWQTLWARVLPTLRPYFILIPGADFSMAFTSEGVNLLNQYIRTLFESFWARFGWMNVRLDSIWYQMLALTSLVAMVGIGALVIRTVKRPAALATWQKKGLVLFFLCIVFAVVVAMGYGVRLWAHFQTFQPDMRPAPQGRYLFPAIIPIASLFMMGLRELVPASYHKLWLLTCVSSLVLLDAISLVHYVIPFFYR